MIQQFSKYEGLGNDFIIVQEDWATASAYTAAQARTLCDRHRGIGADGVLLVSSTADGPRMRVVNSDGSVPEMCGNGLRCVALLLARRAGTPSSEPRLVQTDAGPHRTWVLGDPFAPAVQVEIEMRPPTLVPSEVPVLSDAPWIEHTHEVGGHQLRLTALNVGNPHAVTFDDVGDARLRLGPALAKDPRFPNGVNVGFAKLERPGEITLAVFERGAGWTRACGTGACAAVAAGVQTGRVQVDQPVQVTLPGGRLQIQAGGPDRPIRMRGPARHVFDGTVFDGTVLDDALVDRLQSDEPQDGEPPAGGSQGAG